MLPIQVLTDEESEKLLTYATEVQVGYKTLLTRKRNRLLILLMLDAGLRVGEVVNLQWGDLQIGMIPVHTLKLRAPTTKTHIPRSIPLTPRLQEAIKAWMLKTNALDWIPAEKPVFSVRRTKAQITTRQIQRIIGDLSLKAINRKVHPHMLRHSFATNLMRVTDISTVQSLLGHESVTSTQIYTHPNTSDQAKAIDKLNHGEHSAPPPDNPDTSERD